jgi:hypothetical protein
VGLTRLVRVPPALWGGLPPLVVSTQAHRALGTDIALRWRYGVQGKEWQCVALSLSVWCWPSSPLA